MQINFQPDIWTLLGSGRNHFSRPVDAIAEYVDNAIQACSNQEARDIRICLFLDNRFSVGHFLILDNGSGMNIQGIEDFATFSRSKESRGQGPKGNDRSFLGKFGVGAKQAGFYLGTRIRLFTRVPSEDATTTALTFCLDSEKLLQKAKNSRDSVYSDVVEEVDMSKPPLSSDEAYFPDLSSTLRDHFANNSHGTAFLVCLRDEIVSKLKTMKDGKLVRQINNIYHFHLHPKDFENHLMEARKRDLFPRSGSSTPSGPLKIEFESFRPRKCNTTFDLGATEDFVKECLQDKDNDEIFKFHLKAPLTENTQEYNIDGIFLYFPFDEKETRPFMEVDDSPNHAINIYWQNRLLSSETHLSHMWFFPKLETKRKDRIVGFLFLDYEFDLIMSNKLRLLHDPKEWFKKGSLISTNPTSLTNEFASWLKIRQETDREFMFLNRMEYAPHFKQLEIKKDVLINMGDIIRLNTKKGEITCQVEKFGVEVTLEHDETCHYGFGNVYFKRYPITLHHSETAPVSSINHKLSSRDKVILKALDKKIPCDANIYFFKSKDDDPANLISLKNIFAEDTYYMVGIQILDGDRKVVYYLPEAPKQKEICYSVKLKLKFKSSDKDFGRLSNLCTSSGDSVKSVRHLNCYFAAHNISFSEPGENTFIVSVFGPDVDKPIFEKEIKFTVQVSLPNRFKLELEEDTPLSARLGSFPKIKMQLYRGEKTMRFEGEARVKIESQTMAVLSKTDKDTLVKKLNRADRGQLVCREGDWVAVPKRRDRNFLPVGEYVNVKFNLSVSIRGQREYESIGSIDVDVKFFAGPPKRFRVEPSSPPPVKIRSGGLLPSLRVTVLDEWDNVLAPLSGQVWTLQLSEGPLSKPSHQSMEFTTKGGQVVLTNLPCEQVDNTTEFTQRFNLLCTENNSSRTLLLEDEAGLQVQVIADPGPKSIKMFIGKKELPNKINRQAGDILKNLSFIVLDDDGNEIDIFQRFSGNARILCDWDDSNRMKKRKPDDFLLSDLQIPSKVKSTAPLERTLIVELKKDHRLEFPLTISIDAAQPVKWALRCDSQLSVTVGDEQDLRDKVFGAVWADEHGNLVSCSAVEIAPQLEIFLLDGNAMDMDVADVLATRQPAQRIPLERGEVRVKTSQSSKKRTLDEADGLPDVLQGFIIPAAYEICSFAGARKMILRASNGESKYDPSDPEECRVAPSIPKKVLLSWERFGVTAPQEHITVDVEGFSELSGLLVQFASDAQGDEPRLEEITSLKIEVMDAKNKNVFSKGDVKAQKTLVDLTFDLSRSLLNQIAVEHFECRVSFKHGGKSISLPPARIQCNVLPSNHVVGLGLSVLDDDTHALQGEKDAFSLEVRCGENCPALALSFETANGEAFLPPEDDSLSFIVGAAPSRVDFAQLFSWERDYDNNRIVFHPEDELLYCTTPCVYEMHISYEEERRSLSGLAPTLREKTIKVKVSFVPGPVKKLCLDDDSLEKLRNGVDIDRVDSRPCRIGSFSLHAEDDYENITSFSSNQEVRCRIVAEESDGAMSVSLPELHDKNKGADGLVEGKIIDHRRQCKFDLKIDPNSCSNVRSGRYRLLFTLRDKSIPRPNDNDLSVSVSFELKCIVEKELQPLLKKKEECRKLESELAELQSSLHSTHQTCATVSLNSFEVKDGTSKRNRERNAEEIRSQQLPLPAIRIKDIHTGKDETPSGNPQYLINLLKLSPEDEKLRDTIFFHHLGDTILFDTANDAAQYRKNLVSRREKLPTMVTRNGEKISIDSSAEDVNRRNESQTQKKIAELQQKIRSMDTDKIDRKISELRNL